MKTCNATGNCPHQVIGGSAYIQCAYKNFCDYQLPKDSRTMTIEKMEEKCTCDNYEDIKEFPACPVHGAKK